MSTEIDQRVVQMQFDNKQFEKATADTMSTLDKLKQKLHLTGATKGLEDVDAAAKKVDMSHIGNAVEAVKVKFSALEVMAVTALTNISNMAFNAGKKMVSALTIDPIKQGFQEYETQINAVQTILANTSSKGTTIDDVNSALDMLNTYADKTIYNFTEMTRNIGTFTAAGIDLDKSVSSIQGIANLAAVSGSTSQQASTAMYQLSQALASGTVKLMDWNSVVNAGMGGQVFQDALKRTATVMGTNVDALIEKNGSFRESLKDGWITAEVLTETLNQFTMCAEEGTKEWNEYKKSLKEKGYTDEQATEILKMGKTATEAATKVKTFTQLWDTLKESAQSGWTQSWEIIVGDFEEAKTLLTEVSDTISGILNKSADSRNELLQGWKDMGGRADLIDSFRNAFKAVVAVVTPIKDAFREIFPPATAKQLHNITAGLKSFTEKLKISDETADKLKRTFKGLFSIVDIFKKIITAVAKAIGKLFGSNGVSSLADLILDITASIGDFFTSINEGFKADGFTGALTKIASTVSKVIGKTSEGLQGFGKVLTWIGTAIGNVFSFVWDKVSSVFTWISENISAGDIFAGLAGGGIFLAAKNIMGLVDKVKEVIDGLFGKNGATDKVASLGDKFREVLDSVKESLQAFTTGIKVASLVSIAVAIALLSSSLTKISKLKVGDIAKSLSAMSIMFVMLTQAFKSITKSLNAFPSTGIVKAGIATILMAKAIDILADAIVELSELSLSQIAKGLIAVGGGIFALTKGLKAINGVKISISTSIALLALAKACNMLGDALQKFGSLAWDEIGRGLTSMGIALAEFVAVLAVLNKVGGFKTLLGSASILIAVQALDELSENLKKFSSMSWSEIGRGLTAMGGALSELGLIIGLLGKLSGFSGILGAGAILIGAEALDEIAVALKKFGSMSWGRIGRGLTAMGGALTELGITFGLLGKLAGFSGILGAATVLIGVQALDEISAALKELGSMTWGEIKRGLTAMGGALTELGVIFGLLGYLGGFSGMLGAATILVGVQGLDDLANALIKFGSMSWEEVKRGLAAMGGALGELAVGGLLNTLSIIGAASISEMAEPLGVLADSVKKWSNVTIPDKLGYQLGVLGRALSYFLFKGSAASALATAAPAIGTMADSVKKWTNVVIPKDLVGNLSALADGIEKFTFSGIGASALSTAAEPLGIMADSVKKWASVTVPANIGTQLSSLADGVKSFSWAFMGGWSLSAVAGPLGELADDISKWSSVSLPTNLTTQLTDLSTAIESFSWAFMGGWSLSAISGPLGELAGDIKKWKDVSIPNNIGKQLTSLADAVEEFSFAFVGGWSLSAITGPLGDLAGSVKKWKGVAIPSGLGSQLKTLAEGVKAFSGIGSISKATDGLKSIASSIGKLAGVNISSVSSGLATLTTSLITFASSSKSLSGVGNKLVDNIVAPLTKANSRVSNAATNIVNSLAKGITSKTTTVTSAINTVITKVVAGINNSKSKVTSAVSSLMRSSVNAINGYYGSFVSAGRSVANGFAAGISANTFRATAQARAMALAAYNSAKTALDINSPSKIFRALGYSVPEGFAKGIDRMRKMVVSSSTGMTDAAVNTVSKSISRIADIVNADIDAQPTIRPVIDLSDVASGAGRISNMLSLQPSVGVLANVGSVNAMMRRNQNGANKDVISAIKDLKKAIGESSGNTYIINGVTYDDGTNVSSSVEALIRAIKMERRT